MYSINKPKRKQEIAKQIPDVQIEGRTRRKKLVFAKQTLGHTLAEAGDRKMKPFFAKQAAAGIEIPTVEGPQPSHGVSAEVAMYNFLDATAGRRDSRGGTT